MNHGVVDRVVPLVEATKALAVAIDSCDEPIMERQSVKSTVLASVGYEPDTQVLELEFGSGKIYRYRGVSAELHAWLVRAKDKGGFFRRMIDGKFEYERVDHVDPNAPSLMEALRASLRQTQGESDEPDR
ncbi:MAG: KTSC domain-containing protein [Myxococcota bacterium]